jgi:hydrophobic/amphiphilic exporter-1 (mainly G- bacteria), HAE1 family
VNLIQSFLRNPIKVSVGVLLVALFGIVGLIRMPMQLTPEVQIPTITVATVWPGASPLEVEREIVREQEEFLQSVEGLTKMSSESTDSGGTITLEFKVGTDMESALLKVNSRLQQVPQYPIDADQPVISAASAADRPIAWFILSARLPEREQIEHFARTHPQLAPALEPVLSTDSPGLAELRLRAAARQHPEIASLLPPPIDIPSLRKFAEDYIEAALERVEGVSNSNVFGGREPELQVIVDANKLAARQLTIPDVRRVLQDQNKDTSGGDFWESKRRYVVRTLGQFGSPEDVEQQILAIDNGAPVLVRDVAVVRRGFKKPDGLVRRFGSSGIAVNVQRETGANVLDVMRGLREVEQRLNHGLLADQGLTLTQVYDETEYIYSAVDLVTQNILIGGALTVLVLLIFLRSGRSTLVIGLAIPTSIVGTFLMLYLLGRSLNVISLAGLAFAVGMLVDNAVVVLENIYRHYQRGDSPFVAAERGTREVWGAVVASTITTLAVFLPVMFVEEEAGQLFRDIALAISSAVGLSLIVSVVVIPTASARLFRHHAHTHPHGHAHDDQRRVNNDHRDVDDLDDIFAGPRWLRFFDVLGAGFVNHVVGINAWIQKRTWRRLAVVAALVAASAAGTYLFWPRVEYLPSGNRNLVFAIILPPPGYNLDKMMEIGEFVEEQLRPYWDVEPDSPEAKQLPFPVIGDFFYVARGRQVFVGLRAADATRAGELVPLLFGLRDKLPGSIVVATQSSLFEQGLGTGRAIDVEITGPELDTLRGLGGAILGQVMGWNATGNGRGQYQARPIPSLDKSNPEAQLIPRLVQGAQLGVSAVDLGYTLNALVDGAYATDFYDRQYGGDKIDLVIMGTEAYTGRTQDLQALPVATPSGQLVPVGTLAEVRLEAGPEQVNHRERQRAITIQVSPPPEVALEEAIERLNLEILGPMQASGQVPPECVITLSGSADKLRDTWQALRWNVVLALLITYLLMAALFESWLYPLVIILSVPLGAVGGVLGFQALNVYLLVRGEPPQTLDVLTMLGFVILIGTVVNNAILIVHQSLNHMRLDGWGPRHSILESVRTRIRPIFMTTTTTVIGLMPLVLFPGAGSELYRGLGSVVLGGLLISTVFTLVLVPTLFSLFMDLFGRTEELTTPASRGELPDADADFLTEGGNGDAATVGAAYDDQEDGS